MWARCLVALASVPPARRIQGWPELIEYFRAIGYAGPSGKPFTRRQDLHRHFKLFGPPYPFFKPRRTRLSARIVSDSHMVAIWLMVHQFSVP